MPFLSTIVISFVASQTSLPTVLVGDSNIHPNATKMIDFRDNKNDIDDFCLSFAFCIWFVFAIDSIHRSFIAIYGDNCCICINNTLHFQRTAQNWEKQRKGTMYFFLFNQWRTIHFSKRWQLLIHWDLIMLFLHGNSCHKTTNDGKLHGNALVFHDLQLWRLSLLTHLNHLCAQQYSRTINPSSRAHPLRFNFITMNGLTRADSIF